MRQSRVHSPPRSRNPIVLFDRRIRAPISARWHATTNWAHLLNGRVPLIEQSGIDKIACLALRLNFSMGAERLLRWLLSAGAGRARHSVNSRMDQGSGLYGESSYRDALACCNCRTAPRDFRVQSPESNRSAARRHRAPPRRARRYVALIGFDEMPWAAFLSPPLTVVAQPHTEMASRSQKCS